MYNVHCISSCVHCQNNFILYVIVTYNVHIMMYNVHYYYILQYMVYIAHDVVCVQLTKLGIADTYIKYIIYIYIYIYIYNTLIYIH